MSFFDNLYLHQKQVLEVVTNNTKGIVCLPTGTGKTFCEAAIALNHILENKGFSLVVVNAPRIILTYQLMKEFFSCLASNNTDVRYAFLHSGGGANEGDLEDIRLKANMAGSEISFSQVPSFTSPIDLASFIAQAKNNNIPVIVFSTYHSVDKMETVCNKLSYEIDLMINDEAHYLVQEEFNKVIRNLIAKKTFHFTATMVFTNTDGGRGMNNKAVFGEVLYVMTPRQAIESGLMVRPRIHFINTLESYSYDDYQKSISKIIFESFEHHREFIGLKPKLLVSVRGTQDIKDFKKSDYYKQLREQGVDIYSVSSHAEIGNDINGFRVSRQEFLRELKKAGETADKSLIVLHFDILSEGIDISGFTGILPLRIIGKSKFMQTYGRAARMYPEDRQKLISGEITPGCLDKMLKPFSYIIVPNIIHEDDEYKSNFTSLVLELRDYEFSPFELILLSENARGIPVQVPLENLTDIEKKIPQLGKIITDIISEVESAKIASMDELTFTLMCGLD